MGPSGQDRWGGALFWAAFDGSTDTFKDNYTLENCKKACTDVDACIGISYNPTSRMCFMKDTTAQTLSPSNAVQWYDKNPLST